MLGTIDDFQKMATLAGTVGGLIGGTIVGALDIWWKVRERTDRIKVAYGSIRYRDDPLEYLHVVNRSSHPIELGDYGFIYDKRNPVSLEVYFRHGDQDELQAAVVGGSVLMEKLNDAYEVGVLTDQPIGAYAMTTTMRRARLGFRYDTTLWQQLKARYRFLRHRLGRPL